MHCRRSLGNFSAVSRLPSSSLVQQTLSFDPIFIYIAAGVSGLITFARFVLGWAMRD